MDTTLLFAVAALIGLAVLLVVQRRRQSASASSSRTPSRSVSGSRSRDAARAGRSVEGLDTVMSWEPQGTRLLSASERDAWQLLRRALPEHMVLAQVPLARFLKVPTRYSYAEWMRRVGAQCADLVICDDHAAVQAVVELRAPLRNDQGKLKRRQQRMDRVLTAAGIPVFVWMEGEWPTVVEVRDFMQQAVTGRVTGASKPAMAGAVPGDASVEHLFDPDSESADGDGEARPVSMWFEDQNTDVAPLGPR